MKKILVIAADPMVNFGIVRLLRSRQLDVTAVMNGAIGLALIEIIQPDLVFCETNLPVMNGFRILKHTRQDTKIAHIPFVLIANNTEQATQQRSLKLGADRLLIKPILAATLLTTVAYYLEPTSADSTLSA